jgi:hypothetical protein
MNSLKKWLLPFAVGVFFATLVQTANAPQTGTVLSENSVNCGSKGESHKRSIDLLCQEYVEGKALQIRISRLHSRDFS